MISSKCPYALYLEDFPYACCKVQKEHPVSCPKDYLTCIIYKQKYEIQGNNCNNRSLLFR